MKTPKENDREVTTKLNVGILINDVNFKMTVLIYIFLQQSSYTEEINTPSAVSDFLKWSPVVLITFHKFSDINVLSLFMKAIMYKENKRNRNHLNNF